MKSFTTPDFWEAYAELAPEVKEQAQKRINFGKTIRCILLYTSKK